MCKKSLVGLNHKGKIFQLEVKKLNLFGRILGLMFSRREKAEALLFEFNKPVRVAIHSWFVFFPFYAVWLDDKNKIIEIQRVNSWKFHIQPKKKYFKLIEIPIKNQYKEILEFLDGD